LTASSHSGVPSCTFGAKWAMARRSMAPLAHRHPPQTGKGEQMYDDVVEYQQVAPAAAKGPTSPSVPVTARKTKEGVTGKLLDDPAILHNVPVSPELLDPRRGDPCAGCSHTVVLVMYAAPQGLGDAEGGRIPLRCGSPDAGGRDGWGYRHFLRR